jgi:hypothetical protein
MTEATTQETEDDTFFEGMDETVITESEDKVVENTTVETKTEET